MYILVTNAMHDTELLQQTLGMLDYNRFGFGFYVWCFFRLK